VDAGTTHGAARRSAALIGLWAARSRVLATWQVAAAALTVYAMVPVTRLIPAFHFWLYTTAALILLAGPTVGWVCRKPIVLVSAAVVLVVWYWPTYTGRADIRVGRYLATMRMPTHVVRKPVC
jgi:hypothetical protein